MATMHESCYAVSADDQVRKLAQESLLCFHCKGHLLVGADFLACSECAREYSFQGKYLDTDNPEFAARYGEWFKEEEAEGYEARHSLSDTFSVSATRSVKNVLQRFVELPVQSALEIGCGTGVMTRGYQHHEIARAMLATDISKEMLHQAVRSDLTDNTLYFAMDAHEIPIQDGSFDVVLGGAILHHLTHVETCVSEFARVLNDRGLAVFQEPFYYGNQFLVFLIRAILERMEMAQCGSAEERRTLMNAVDSYAGNIEFRHSNRRQPERLAQQDDKHLFLKDEMVALARKVGFADVEFIAPWRVESSDGPPSNIKVWKVIAIEIIEALKGEVGLRGKLEFDYSNLAFLETFDDLIGNDLLDCIAPQEIVLFRK